MSHVNNFLSFFETERFWPKISLAQVPAHQAHPRQLMLINDIFYHGLRRPADRIIFAGEGRMVKVGT
jgi:hypothetical protein